MTARVLIWKVSFSHSVLLAARTNSLRHSQASFVRMSLQKYRRGANLSKAVEAAARLAKKEEEDLFMDMVQAVKDNEAQAIRVKFDRQLFKLPRTVTAWLPLFLNKSDGSDKDNLKLIESLLGADFAKKIVSDKNNFVSFDLVNDKILTPVMARWGIDFTNATEKNEKTPDS